MALEDDTMMYNQRNKMPTSIERLNSLIKIVLRRWWLFAIVGLIAGVAGIIYASYQRPIYKSHLTFALDEGEKGGSIGNIMSLASQFGLSIGGGKDIFAGDNILEIMKSRRIVEQVLLSTDTFETKPYTFIEYYLRKIEKLKPNSKIKNIHFPVGQQRSTFSYQQDSLLYKMYQKFSDNYITAQRPDRKLSIFEVNVTSHNEKFTKDFTDRLIEEANNFYIEIRTKKAKETLTILEERAAAMKGGLNTSISQKATVQDVNINPAFSEALVPVQKQQANIQVYGAAYGEMFKNLELARFQYLNEIPLLQIIDAANYPMEKIKTGKLKTAIIFAVLAEMLLLSVIGLRNLFANKNLS